MLIQCGVQLEWFLKINPVHSWILTQLSSEMGNLSRGLLIGWSASEKFSEMTPINNVYWSYFRINHVKTLIVNLKLLESLIFF